MSGDEDFDQLLREEEERVIERLLEQQQPPDGVGERVGAQAAEVPSVRTRNQGRQNVNYQEDLDSSDEEPTRVRRTTNGDQNVSHQQPTFTPTPPASNRGDDEPRNRDAAEVEPDADAEPRYTDAAEVGPEPCRPGLQPKLNTVLCREASDVAPGVGTFARAEASLMFEGATYHWPMSDLEDGFDGSGPFLAARMKACITNAIGDDFKTFSDSIRPENITGLKTTQPMLKPLPDAPRGHDANASDLVVVTGKGRYLYTNRSRADGTICPIAYAARETSEALLGSTATMYFRTDASFACPCGVPSLTHAATAKFDAVTGLPSLSIEHETANGSFPCSMQPADGWEVSPLDLGLVLQVSTWPEHEVRALQAEHTPEFVAPYETEAAALALCDKTYKVTILTDLLDAKLGGAIVKCGAVTKPALFCADMNTRLWSMLELSQSTLIDNQVDLLCNHAMVMGKRSEDELKLIKRRLEERSENAGWPDLLFVKKPDDDDDEEGDDDTEGRKVAKLRNGLQRPHLRSWYDNVSLHQTNTAKQLLKRVAHRDISPFNPPQLLPFKDGQLLDFGQRGSRGFVRRIEQSDMLTKTLPYALKDLDSDLLPNLDTATEAEMRAFGQRLGDEEATLEYRKFMKLYFNYDGGVMYRLSVVAKGLVGDTFHSALYVQLGARMSNGDFIQGAGKGMPSKLDQDALGAYADSCPLSLLFYKEKVDGASPGLAKLEAKRYVLIDEANRQQNQSGVDQVINPNMLRRLVPQGPEVKLSARQLYEGHLQFYAQIISLVVNLNNMYAGLMDGRRAQAIHLSTVFLPGDEYDRWVTADHDPNVLSAKWRDSVLAVAGADGSAKHNVQRKANGNPYPPEMWNRMASVHLGCATLLARRCVMTGKQWPAVPKVNEDLTNLLLKEEANRASSAGNGIDAATLERLSDAWYEYAAPCKTELKGGKSTVPHACKCTRDGHERWCVVGVDGFSTWLSQTNGPLSKAVQATKGATHMIALLKQAVPELETAHCDKAARAPTGTMYAKERPRNAIVHWWAKSEGKLNPKKSSKAPVARADKHTKRKTATFGAEQGNAKKQKSIVQMNIHTSKSDASDEDDDDDDGSTRDETESSHDD